MRFKNESELEEFMSRPPEAVVKFIQGLDGDIMLLGAAGKIGVTLGLMAARAARAAGSSIRVRAVSRFSDPAARADLESAGVETIPCDLLDPAAVAALPKSPNVIFLAGRKFGTSGASDLTWASNVLIPAYVASSFRDSRIVAFSTGCVYEFVKPSSGGSSETDEPKPVGEYAQSTLGRERVFEYFSKLNGTPVCLFRLNYAIDARYGVLCDIAEKVMKGEPVDLSAGAFNCIWQGDVLARAILCLGHCDSPPSAINITGPETVSVRWAAEELGARLGRKPIFSGEDRQDSPVYLSNPALSIRLFGYPSLGLSEMMDIVAEWMKSGGRSLGKPTHFETTDGKY